MRVGGVGLASLRPRPRFRASPAHALVSFAVSGRMNTNARPSPADSLKSGAAEAPKPLDSAAVTKRLQQELMSMMSSADSGVSAFPDGDSLFAWVGTLSVRELGFRGRSGLLSSRRLRRLSGGAASPCVQGASGTVYENLTYRLSLRFTAEYPFKAPTVRFETPCFHPNVDTYGNICLDILKDKWSGAWSP